MGQRTETFLAMVGTHAGVTYATERQVVLEHMPGPVIQGHAAAVGVFEQVLGLAVVQPEGVERQRSWAGLPR